jgi:quercetin dioxygenase-like cupin family protein
MAPLALFGPAGLSVDHGGGVVLRSQKVKPGEESPGFFASFRKNFRAMIRSAGPLSHYRMRGDYSMTLQTIDDVRYVPAGTGPTYWGPGDQVRFLITGKETGGALFMAEVLVPPGGGVPPHIHQREEESFRILRGTLTVQVGGRTLQASPGDLVHLPRGVVHCFRNDGNVDATFLVVVTPAGLENFFAEAFYPAVDDSTAPPPLTEALMARLHAAALRHGIALVPPGK